MKPCSRMPRPSAIAPRIIASVSPTSWMIGCAEEAARPTRAARAGPRSRTQCTTHRPDRPIAIRSSRAMVADAVASSRRDIRSRVRELQYIIGRHFGPCPAARRTRIAACLMDSALASAAPRAAKPRTRRAPCRTCSSFVAALVFAMVVVGGITRLTESGLSITEWKPISGAIPPLTHADWAHAFDLYKQTPQYQQVAGPGRNDAWPASSSSSSGNGSHRLLGRVHRARLLRRRRLVRVRSARSPAATAGGSPRCSCSAACRARSAGSWSCRASRAAPRSAPTACPRICCSRCSCSAR